MPIILDASVALSWAFPDESIQWTRRLLKELGSGDPILVPAHWPIEIANGILMAIRRGRATRDDADEFAKALRGLRITVDPSTGPAGWLGVLDVADRNKLTAYDAAYLALATRTGWPLATLDSALIRAARGTGPASFPSGFQLSIPE